MTPTARSQKLLLTSVEVPKIPRGQAWVVPGLGGEVKTCPRHPTGTIRNGVPLMKSCKVSAEADVAGAVIERDGTNNRSSVVITPAPE